MIDRAMARDTPEEGAFSGFGAAFEAVRCRTDHALTAAPGLIRSYTAHLAGARGKMIRAAALLACAQDADGRIPADAACLAAAVELLHLATLVHDDVMDDADVRRGAATLQKKYGKRTAVICGDYLLGVALRTAATVGDREKYLDMCLPDYIGRVCQGELRQHINNGNLGLSVYQYLRIINGKTAALFEASFYAGAFFCTRDEQRLRRYRMLGRGVGMIFQLTDDCIDFESDEATAKKPVQSDYEQGIVTLPLIRALEKDELFRARARQKALTREDLNAKIMENGGLDYTRWLSKRYYSRAARLVEALSLPREKYSRLMGILDKAYYGLEQPPANRNHLEEEAE